MNSGLGPGSVHTGGAVRSRWDKADCDILVGDCEAPGSSMFSAGLGARVALASWTAGFLSCGWAMAKGGPEWDPLN